MPRWETAWSSTVIASEPDRDGEILEVRGDDGRPPYIVGWSDDGRVG